MPTRPALERALVARVAERVTAAGRRVEPAALERIVRKVLDRLRDETDGAEPEDDPAVLVFVVETRHGARDVATLRTVLGRAAGRVGARLVAAHREPRWGHLPKPAAGGRPVAKSLETP
ncbi:MAG TPA: hypothetical protein VF192_06560 [Longimicrobiales bacterium]